MSYLLFGILKNKWKREEFWKTRNGSGIIRLCLVLLQETFSQNAATRVSSTP